MPYEETDFLSEFREIEDGEGDMIHTIQEWATQVIEPGRRYVKKIRSSNTDLANYCVVELTRSPRSSRIFTVSVDTFVETDPKDRLELVAQLKSSLDSLKSVEVLQKQMGSFLVAVRLHDPASRTTSLKERLLVSQHNHASWDLVKASELFPLLMRRRAEIGGFHLLDWTDNYACFAKLLPGNEWSRDSGPGDLVQYQVAILEEKLVVDLHMESASSEFLLRSPGNIDSNSNFNRVARILKKRDQECGRALKCRTSLLKVFGDSATEVHVSCVQRLLAYASRTSIRLRFFHEGSGSANRELRSLTEESLLSNAFGVKVAKLNIDSSLQVTDLDRGGDWFIVEYDKQTMSLTHLSSKNIEGSKPGEDGSLTFRELTFFTISIGDVSCSLH